MRKSTLFISAVLTTFVMAMLAGVASAYQSVVNNDQVVAQSQPQAQTVAEVAPAPTPTEVQPVNWTPEQAAALAAQVLGHDDLYSVEITDLNGETVYMVTFSSGDLVYVSLDGQLRSIGNVPVETVVVNSGGGGRGGGGGGGNTIQPASSSGGHEEHEEHNEQESHDDD
jgi:uncharacterized membrane protein YgcG